jgi:hypothetical protein
MNLLTTYQYAGNNVLERRRLVQKPSITFPEPDWEKEALLKEISIEVYHFLVDHLIPERNNVCVIDTKDSVVLEKRIGQGARSVVNVHRLNEVRYINNFLEGLNHCLPDAGIFIGCVESVRNIWDKKKKVYGPVFFRIYWILVFLFHRVMPKVSYLQKLYFLLTKGRYRWLTMAETLGRLVSCGFEIIEYKEIDGLLYFSVIKTREPYYGRNASFGPLFGMNRVGRYGKLMKVYKLRTMHPYSEYLQEYVTQLNGYSKTGKPKDDFRVATWGRFYRKYWIDEIPQLYNVLKGEMTIVGVRPLSETRFKELPEDLQKMRIRFKPGCIPPYVALLMPDAHGNIEAERIYLAEKLKRPIFTDFKYFFMAVSNILLGKIKSS